MNKNFWLHTKNLDALSFLSEKKTNCFCHQEDSYTLTSNGNILWSDNLEYALSSPMLHNIDGF